MSTIERDTTPAALATACEENLSSWIPLFGSLGAACRDDPPGVYRAVAHVPISLFNSITDARLAPEEADLTIEYVRADGEARRAPLLWWVGPSSRPADLGQRLERRGFVRDEDGPWMAVELAALNEGLAVPDGLSIQLVEDDVARPVWCRTMLQGYEVPPTVLDRGVSAWHELLCHADRDTVRAYLACWNGEPVATSLLRLGGGVAGIYAVATTPDARRRGIGARVTLEPLLEARRMGFHIGVLGASEMGEGVYRSLGFRECCRMTTYVWRPAA